jgi:Fe-S cluster assembly iron-binding protein IscA
MLALTDDAQQAIEEIIDGAESAAGIRIAPKVDAEVSGELQMTVVDAPDETDQVLDSGSGSLFVDAAAASFLDDKVLDASVDGDAVQFEVVSQAR